MRDKLGEILRKRLWEEYQSGHEPDATGQEPQRPNAGLNSDSNSDSVWASKPGQWIGGAVSLALVLGAVYWVFELGRRDANEVPVIKAMNGAARVVPTNSGGPDVDNQGLQVNEVLSSGTTAPVESETTLAPPPQRIIAQDIVPEAQPFAPVSPIVLAPRTVPPVPPVPDTQTPAPQTPAPQTRAPQTPAFSLPPSLPGANPNMSRPARRILAGPALSPTADILSGAIEAAIKEATAAGASAAPATAPSAPLNTPLNMDPFAAENMIQLGAYDNEQTALQTYDALLKDNQDLMGHLERYVVRREAGGRVFYWLRARGFANLAEASAMCKALLARSVPCIDVPAQ